MTVSNSARPMRDRGAAIRANAWRATPANRRCAAAAVAGATAIFANDTSIKLQAPGEGRTRTARIWIYVRDERPWLGPAPPAACYRFTVDRDMYNQRTSVRLFRPSITQSGSPSRAEANRT